MAIKGQKNLTKSFDLTEVMRSARFLGADLDLKHYQKSTIREYILDSCDRTKYIEAHSLAIQYANEAIIVFTSSKLTGKLNDTQTTLAMQVMASTGIITANFYHKYNAVKSVRNRLEHKLLTDHEFLEKLKKKSPSQYRKEITMLLDETDRQFLTWAMEYRDKFTPTSENFERYMLVNYIISPEVIKLILPRVSKYAQPSKEFDKHFKNEYILEIDNLLKKKGLGHLVLKRK